MSGEFSNRNATLILTDVMQMVSIMREVSDELKLITLINDYYAYASKYIADHGGEVIKYSGDACLGIFGEDQVTSAIDALKAMRADWPEFCEAHEVTPTGIKGSVHIGEVFVGKFGPQRLPDVMGKAVNVLFSMEGPGITLSEQAYRKLPSDKRGPFSKHGGHVTYVMK